MRTRRTPSVRSCSASPHSPSSILDCRGPHQKNGAYGNSLRIRCVWLDVALREYCRYHLEALGDQCSATGKPTGKSGDTGGSKGITPLFPSITSELLT